MGMQLCPPEIKNTPEAPAAAAERLQKMGPMSRDEKIMLGTMAFAVVLWVTGDAIGVSSVVAAMLGKLPCNIFKGAFRHPGTLCLRCSCLVSFCVGSAAWAWAQTVSVTAGGAGGRPDSKHAHPASMLSLKRTADNRVNVVYI